MQKIEGCNFSPDFFCLEKGMKQQLSKNMFGPMANKSLVKGKNKSLSA